MRQTNGISSFPDRAPDCFLITSFEGGIEKEKEKENDLNCFIFMQTHKV